MSDLFNVAGPTKLPDLEKAILSGLVVRETTAGGESVSLADYGIEAVDVGVTRVMLPEETTKAVFERMGPPAAIASPPRSRPRVRPSPRPSAIPRRTVRG